MTESLRSRCGSVASAGRHSKAAGQSEGSTPVRLIAFVVSATAVVEGTGAYPPLEVLHSIVYANVVSLLVLLGFLFVAAVSVGRLVRRQVARSTR